MSVIKQPRPDRVRNAWIRNHFKGEDVFIVGGGPSLIGFDFRKLRGRNVIAINHAYQYCDPQVVVFLDARFRHDMEQRGHSFDDYKWRMIVGPSSQMHTHPRASLVYLTSEPTNELTRMFGKASSSLVAINSALIMGARRIFLLGMDCKFVPSGEGKVGHFYSSEWTHPRDHDEQAYRRMLPHFSKFRRHKNIFNCSRISMIDAFQFVDVEEALA